MITQSTPETHARSKRTRGWLIFAAMMLLALLVALVSCALLDVQELDLYSGRARYSRQLPYWVVSREIRDTPMSEALDAAGDADAGEKWVVVNTFCPLLEHNGISPHYIYHGAFYVCDNLTAMWEMHLFTPDARATSARQLLRAMREDGSYFGGHYYVRALDDVIGLDHVEGRSISASDIPHDLVERALARLEHLP